METYSDQHREGDIHNRLMKNYRTIPQWWFYAILSFCTVISIFLIYFEPQLQFPLWGLLVAIGTSVIVTLTEGVFLATSNQVLVIGKMVLLTLQDA